MLWPDCIRIGAMPTPVCIWLAFFGSIKQKLASKRGASFSPAPGSPENKGAFSWAVKNLSMR